MGFSSSTMMDFGELKMADGPRIRREKKTVDAMIRLYCSKHHENAGGLCPDCQELHDYAMLRLSNCPFQENKTICAKCLVHCYKPALRTKNIEGYEIFRTPHVISTSHFGVAPRL